MIRFLAALTFIATACGQTPEMRRWADHWSDEFGIERELVYAVIEVESAWNSRAVSSAGAIGLMQLMPATATTFRVRNRFDVSENIRGGVAYLAWLSQQCRGDWRLVLASYNAGLRRVMTSGLNFASPSVRAYVNKVAYRRNRWKKSGTKE
ncbi:MAG: lytic transglycosylase domain-containing protein [Bryobacteraceae bacterium]